MNLIQNSQQLIQNQAFQSQISPQNITSPKLSILKPRVHQSESFTKYKHERNRSDLPSQQQNRPLRKKSLNQSFQLNQQNFYPVTQSHQASPTAINNYVQQNSFIQKHQRDLSSNQPSFVSQHQQQSVLNSTALPFNRMTNSAQIQGTGSNGNSIYLYNGQTQQYVNNSNLQQILQEPIYIDRKHGHKMKAMTAKSSPKSGKVPIDQFAQYCAVKSPPKFSQITNTKQQLIEQYQPAQQKSQNNPLAQSQIMQSSRPNSATAKNLIIGMDSRKQNASLSTPSSPKQIGKLHNKLSFQHQVKQKQNRQSRPNTQSNPFNDLKQVMVLKPSMIHREQEEIARSQEPLQIGRGANIAASPPSIAKQQIQFSNSGNPQNTNPQVINILKQISSGKTNNNNNNQESSLSKIYGNQFKTQSYENRSATDKVPIIKKSAINNSFVGNTLDLSKDIGIKQNVLNISMDQRSPNYRKASIDQTTLSDEGDTVEEVKPRILYKNHQIRKLSNNFVKQPTSQSLNLSADDQKQNIIAQSLHQKKPSTSNNKVHQLIEEDKGLVYKKASQYFSQPSSPNEKNMSSSGSRKRIQMNLLRDQLRKSNDQIAQVSTIANTPLTINQTPIKVQSKGEERFNVITKFAFATTVGYIPGNPYKQNQDSFILNPNLSGIQGLHFFAVCDGHGQNGHHVSNLIKEKLASQITDYFKQQPLDNDLQILIQNKNQFHQLVPESLKWSFRYLHQNMSKQPYDVILSGSTCCSILFDTNTLFVANSGDSRAMMCSYSPKTGIKITQLSNDHKPSLPEEAIRIRNSGGRIETFKGPNGENLGPERVWLMHDDSPGLAMSRSIGDYQAHSIGVIPDPEISKFDLSADDKFIVIASDGVWEFLENEKVAEIVWPYFVKHSPEAAGNALVRAAAQKWKENDTVIDDITCIIIFMEVD